MNDASRSKSYLRVRGSRLKPHRQKQHDSQSFEASDETILKRGYLALRSMDGLNQYEIQLPSDAVAKMRRDWPIAILIGVRSVVV